MKKITFLKSDPDKKRSSNEVIQEEIDNQLKYDEYLKKERIGRCVTNIDNGTPGDGCFRGTCYPTLDEIDGEE
jgi:hypothetical protein